MIPDTISGVVFGTIILLVIAVAFTVLVLLIAWIVDKLDLVDPPGGHLVIKESETDE